VEGNLGLLAKTQGHPEQAVGSFQEAARLLRLLVDRFPGMPAYRMKLAMAEINLGESLARIAPGEAEVGLCKAGKEQSAVPDKCRDPPEYQRDAAVGHYKLAKLLVENKHEPIEAVRHAEGAVALDEQVLVHTDLDRDRVTLTEDLVLLTLALIEAHRLPD